MIAIGDIVERSDGKPLACSRGRVTGFAPNGNVRVKLENDQDRIWPVTALRSLSEDSPVIAPLDERLDAELDDDTVNLLLNNFDKLFGRRSAPAAMKKNLEYILDQRLILDVKKFAARVDADGERGIWNAFVAGFTRY